VADHMSATAYSDLDDEFVGSGDFDARFEGVPVRCVEKQESVYPSRYRCLRVVAAAAVYLRNRRRAQMGLTDIGVADDTSAAKN
jgi:hypothetical protein